MVFWESAPQWSMSTMSKLSEEEGGNSPVGLSETTLGNDQLPNVSRSSLQGASSQDVDHDHQVPRTYPDRTGSRQTLPRSLPQARRWHARRFRCRRGQRHRWVSDTNAAHQSERRSRLVREHQNRRGDPAFGGSTRAPVMTAYRQQALGCTAALVAEPLRVRDLRAGMPEAGKILFECIRLV